MNDASNNHVVPTDIAIVGMAARFPGANSAAEYWQNLRSGEESIRQRSEEDLLAAGVSAAELRNPNYVRAAGPLDDVAGFDAAFFGYSPKDAAILDPQHRHFYECAWQALEQTGHTAASLNHAIGVFAGCGPNLYFMNHVVTNPELQRSVGFFLLRHTGNDRDFLPTGVSYKLNLCGPSVAVQTACSTSLVAIHMACQSLLNGECDLALAGGVSIYVPHGHGYVFRENEILSRDGHCRPFDASASGTVVTNGCGVVALRRAEDAIDDGDFIHALVKGSAINNDGANKVGYLAPSVEGHAAAVNEALGMAGMTADNISYVETHGTGTAVGDPIEIAALSQAFRSTTEASQFCPIGSVKANIGHTDTAAGVAGVIKVVEALKHREIPPSINFNSPNPHIDFEASPFFVNTRLQQWESDGAPLCAGVSSLGVGGTNAHAVLQEPPVRSASEAAEPWQPLLLSAKTPNALSQMIANLADYLDANPRCNLADVAYTLQVGREKFGQRCALVANDVADAVNALQTVDRNRLRFGKSAADAPSIAFLFPGGGVQYPNMGRDLYETYEVYRNAMDSCLDLLAGEFEPDLRSMIYPAPGNEETAAAQLREAGPSVCAIFATEYATARLLMSWGIEPTALIGHSLGEYTAACLSGVMSLEDALKIVALRGRILGRVAGAAMMSVPLSEEETLALLGDDLDLAAVNGPSLCLVSGENESLDRLEKQLAEQEVECRRLHIATASHCRLLDPLLDEFRAGLETIKFHDPQIPYISNVTGTWVRTEDLRDPGYWVRHLRHCVRFASGIGELLSQPNRALVEVGPGRALTSLARQQTQKPACAVTTLRHPEEQANDAQYLQSCLGELWTAGVAVDWSQFRGTSRRLRVPLPTYPFEHQPYWLEPSESTTAAPELVPLERTADVDDWLYEAGWEEAPVSAAADTADNDNESAATLVFLDDEGVGARLVKCLRQQGVNVVTVREGDAFHEFTEHEYALAAEEGYSGYQRLFSRLEECGCLPNRIIHLWLLTEGRKFRAGSSFFHRNQERGLYSLVFLVQAIGELEINDAIQVDVVSTGIQSVKDEPTEDPEKATVLGPIRVIPTEFPNITTRSIDVDLPNSNRQRQTDDPRDAIVERLLREASADPAQRVVAYRGERRFVESFSQHTMPQPENGHGRLREEGVYLITGGLGGLGMELARHLAVNYRARLILIGRSEFPARSTWDDWLARHVDRDQTSRKIHAIREMESNGARVLTLQADIANIKEMEQAIEAAKAEFGPMHGVFHVAGVLDDGLIQTRTAEAIDRVLTPKVHGTLILAELLQAEPIDFLTLFSSTSALLGLPGQSDYAAANSFLDAFARSSAGRHLNTVALNWGIWKDVGMGHAAALRLADQAADELSDSPLERTEHPLLDECISRCPTEAVFSTRLSPENQWILDEHRSQSGLSIVPGTGYLEFASAAFTQAVGECPVEISDLAIISPLAIAENETRELRTMISQNGKGHHFEAKSRVDGQWQVHAEATISALETCAPEQLDVAAILARCNRAMPTDNNGLLQTRQMELLQFGPRWRVVRSAHFGEGEAIAELSLPDDYVADVADYRLHPALLDLATGFALPLIEGYENAKDLYVPMAYQRLQAIGRLEKRIYSHVRSHVDNSIDRDVATFDITIVDESGNVLVEINQFTVRRVGESRTFGQSHGSQSTHARSQTAAEELFLETHAAGIDTEHGMRSLTTILNSPTLPHQVIVSSIDLDELAKRISHLKLSSEQSTVKFERPGLSSQFEPPRNKLEERLASIWEELLGIDQIGVHDDFFELGGHSLIAVRLFAKIKNIWGAEFPISVLFQAPTIVGCAELIQTEVGEEVLDSVPQSSSRRAPKFRYLVPMNRVEGNTNRPPFFLVAGMFGNVLNLRHLAGHLGEHQPVFAVQARGLYGDDEPHNRFEDMARDYLEEIRQIQPEGPYFIGGFSGGGIAAYEMAQQIRANGEQIGLLVFLDSSPPPDVVPQVTWRDRGVIQLQRLVKQGPAYVRQWAVNRIRWEARRFRREEEVELTPAEFRSRDIHIAFLEALGHYKPQRYEGSIHLFRPALQKTHRLGGERFANGWRELVDDRNHWSPYVHGDIHVHEVTGDHDAMVLEPHVRVLAAELKTCLSAAQDLIR